MSSVQLHPRTARLPLLLLLLLLAGVGCGQDDQTGLPQPFPLPQPNVLNMRASGVVPGLEAEVQLVGLPGAVAGAGEVTVKNGAAQSKARSTAEGSFVAAIAARAGDALQITIESSPSAELTVKAFAVTSVMPPGPIPGVPPLSGPDAGLVKVTGQADPLGRVIAVNLENGSVTSAQPDPANGRFDLQLSAAAGHVLRIYEDTDPLAGYWELTVP